MTTKFYSYSLPTKIAKAVGWFMAVMVGGSLVMTVIGVLTAFAQHRYSQAGLLGSLETILGMLFGLLVCLGVIHNFPNIQIDEQRIQVQFMWWYIPIPWDDIIVIEDYVSITVRSVRVKAQRITWLHYIYGLSHPAFMIYSSIEGYPELVHEIKSHCNTKSK